MKILLDTSTLAKRYVQELGSEELEDLFFSVVKEVFVSTLALAEFAAAIGRKLRNKEMLEKSASKAMRELEKDWNGLFKKIPLTEDLAMSAASLAIQYPLKGADAIHLASAIAVGADLFVVSDNMLVSVAEKIGIKTYNPIAGRFQC
ncbi:MAG: type II toxin-antitoxin system VapC family toxin [Candidatus Aminicenantes bacterium]|nr:type II toxin-antitoxin system VapC family toxin [Candidatus Aminicenantes bacterium]